MEINTVTKTVICSFTVGYMVSQLNILGFALGCGFMFVLQCMPNNYLWEKLQQNKNLLELFNQKATTTTTATFVGETNGKS
jgi:hypothetical protein